MSNNNKSSRISTVVNTSYNLFCVVCCCFCCFYCEPTIGFLISNKSKSISSPFKRDKQDEKKEVIIYDIPPIITDNIVTFVTYPTTPVDFIEDENNKQITESKQDIAKT
ncbi:hypothetical protein ABK040_007033 [Willaertia magna]